MNANTTTFTPTTRQLEKGGADYAKETARKKMENYLPCMTGWERFAQDIESWLRRELGAESPQMNGEQVEAYVRGYLWGAFIEFGFHVVRSQGYKL